MWEIRRVAYMPPPRTPPGLDVGFHVASHIILIASNRAAALIKDARRLVKPVVVASDNGRFVKIAAERHALFTAGLCFSWWRQ